MQSEEDSWASISLWKAVAKEKMNEQGEHRFSVKSMSHERSDPKRLAEKQVRLTFPRAFHSHGTHGNQKIPLKIAGWKKKQKIHENPIEMADDWG